MPESPLRLIERSAEFIPKHRISEVPQRLRGIYVLYNEARTPGRGHKRRADVLYVGMTTAGRQGGVQRRLRAHKESKRKGPLWTHFSVFKVWDNIRDEEIAELEGLFRHIYRRDSKANRLNIQRGFKRAYAVRNDKLTTWIV
jgi:hypothetical protein